MNFTLKTTGANGRIYLNGYKSLLDPWFSGYNHPDLNGWILKVYEKMHKYYVYTQVQMNVPYSKVSLKRTIVFKFYGSMPIITIG